MKTVRLFIVVFFVSITSCKESINDSRLPVSKSETVTTQLNKTTATDTLFEDKNYLVLGQSGTRIKLVTKKDTLSYEGFYTHTQTEDGVFLTNIPEDKSIQVYRKYKPKFTFENFNVALYKKRLPKVLYVSHPLGISHKTRIEEAVGKGINFGGKFTIASWGCGTACQQHVIIDRSTGIIVTDFSSALGIEYRSDSLLILKNIGALDSKTGLLDICAYCKVTPVLWNATENKLTSPLVKN